MIGNINLGRACAIFIQIDSDSYSIDEKSSAIHTVLNMPTHNSVSKGSMLGVIKYLYGRLEAETIRTDDAEGNNNGILGSGSEKRRALAGLCMNADGTWKNTEESFAITALLSTLDNIASDCDRWKARAEALERAIKENSLTHNSRTNNVNAICDLCVRRGNCWSDCSGYDCFEFDEARFSTGKGVQG